MGSGYDYPLGAPLDNSLDSNISPSTGNFPAYTAWCNSSKQRNLVKGNVGVFHFLMGTFSVFPSKGYVGNTP